MDNSKQTQTSRSIFRNVLYGFSTWILPLALTFVATPLILKSLGNEDYGIYALVLGLISYSFNLSFGRAITKYTAEYRASGEVEKIRDVISATLFINLLVGAVVVVGFFLAAKFLVAEVFQIKSEDQEKTVLAIYVAALTIFFLLINQVFNSVLQGIHRFDIYSKITNFNSAAIILGNILIAYNGYGLTVLFLWNLLITFISGILFIVAAKRHLPEFGITFRFHKETIKTVLIFSAGVIGYQILANLFVLFERGWITRTLGAENLTYYVVPMSIAVYIHSFISSIVLVIFPLASELKNDREKLLRLYLKAAKVICFLVVFICLTAIIQSGNFLTLWLGADFAAKAQLLMVLHVLTFSMLAIQTNAWQLTEGLGYPQFNTIIYGVCLAINIFFVFMLSSNHGILGIAAARLIAFTFLFSSIFYVEKWLLGKIQVKFWFRTILYLGGAAAFSAVFQETIKYRFPANWIWLFISVAVGGVVYLGSFFLTNYATAQEKLLMKSFLRR